MDKIGSPYGLWLNKRTIVTIGLSFRHTLSPGGAGWHLIADESGQILIGFVDGDEQTIVVDPGDQVLASGDDLYLALQRPAGYPDEDERGERPEEHYEERPERPGQKPDRGEAGR